MIAVGLLCVWARSSWRWSWINGTCEPLVPLTSVYRGVKVVCLIGGAIVSTAVSVVWFSIGILRWSGERKIRS